jgi:hypothetical protein
MWNKLWIVYKSFYRTEQDTQSRFKIHEAEHGDRSNAERLFEDETSR